MSYQLSAISALSYQLPASRVFRRAHLTYKLSAVSYQRLSVLSFQLPEHLSCLSRHTLDSRLTSHDSRLTLSQFTAHDSHTHNSQLTTHVSRFTSHDSRLTIFAPSKLQIGDLIISLPCVLRNPGVQRFSSIFHFRLLQSHRVVRS